MTPTNAETFSKKNPFSYYNEDKVNNQEDTPNKMNHYLYSTK